MFNSINNIKIKKFCSFFKNGFTRRLAFFVFYENALVLSKFSFVKLKKKQYLHFYKKFRFLQACAIKSIKRRRFNAFNLYKKNLSFNKFLKGGQEDISLKLESVKSLIKLSFLVKNLILDLKLRYSKRITTYKAFLILNNILNAYTEMFTVWDENEKWGFFDMDLSYETKKNLMKYFWPGTSGNRGDKLSLIEQILGGEKYNLLEKCQIVGYEMRSLKFTDNLFFWHTFTTKKIQHNFWLLRSKKFFKVLFLLKQSTFAGDRQLKKKISQFVLMFSSLKLYDNFFSNSFFFSKNWSWFMLFCFKQEFFYFLIYKNVFLQSEFFLYLRCDWKVINKALKFMALTSGIRKNITVFLYFFKTLIFFNVIFLNLKKKFGFIHRYLYDLFLVNLNLNFFFDKYLYLYQKNFSKPLKFLFLYPTYNLLFIFDMYLKCVTQFNKLIDFSLFLYKRKKKFINLLNNYVLGLNL